MITVISKSPAGGLLFIGCKHIPTPIWETKILLGQALVSYTSASARLICVLPCVFWTNTQLWKHFARTLISVIYQASTFHQVPHTPWQYLITSAYRKRSWFSRSLSNFPIFPLSNFPFLDPCSTSSHSSVLYMELNTLIFCPPWQNTVMCLWWWLWKYSYFIFNKLYFVAGEIAQNLRAWLFFKGIWIWYPAGSLAFLSDLCGHWTQVVHKQRCRQNT